MCLRLLLQTGRLKHFPTYSHVLLFEICDQGINFTPSFIDDLALEKVPKTQNKETK